MQIHTPFVDKLDSAHLLIIQLFSPGLHALFVTR